MWSRKFEKCINCGTTDIKHVAKGLCIRCYTLNTEAEHKKHNRYKRGVADDFLTKDKLVELYVERGMSLTDIGKLAGCTRVNVHYKLKKYNIIARSKRIARSMALDKGKIKTSRLDKSGNKEEVVFQKIRYNKKFFKEWSPEMAYVLGLIYTDGNLHIRKDKSGYELGILSFAQKERELVEKFLNLMECNATIRFKEKIELANTTAGELYYCSIGNNELSEDLTKLGVIPTKSLNMRFPEIPDEYFRHFVRGLFDGDGSVYIDKKTVRVKLLSGSFVFIQMLQKKMNEHGFPQRKIDIRYITKNDMITSNAHVICFSAKSCVKQFFEFIYNDVPEEMYYTRKHDMFIKNRKLLEYKNQNSL